MKHNIILYFLLFQTFISYSQPDRWQQHVVYDMNIDFDVNTHRYNGTQNIVYTNNSPDTLYKVFYHLYFNAFQPGSMMDVRSRTVADPDRRVGARIAKLSESEIGYQKINSLTLDGVPVKYHVVGTILEVDLSKPILPSTSVQLAMEFESQVPIQIRRTGRDNKEGIDYSMAQWYPKLAEYDYQGWHANPYIAREFYGVWGDFNVNISMDKNYLVAASGVLQNAKDIGYGYSDEVGISSNVEGDKINWNFKAENVHDFLWAADRDYKHTKLTTTSGTILHFYYQENEKTKENWENLPRIMDAALEYLNANYGEYPYPVYSFIQGGDGGMEYPMATLITGERSFPSLVGVSVHEWMHSWYQMILGTNESLHPWMDEGFTSFGTSETMNYLREVKLMPGEVADNPHERTIRGYINFNSTGQEESISTHSDHYSSNRAYGIAAYTKGQVFLKQLQYIIGENAFARGLLKYYDTWKFKHPNPNDFIRIFEKESGIELDWYKEYMVNTTKTIDYGIDTVLSSNGKTIIALEKLGQMPMPVDITIVDILGEEYYYNIPLRIMRGDKRNNSSVDWNVSMDWPWVYPNYDLEVNIPTDRIKSVHIDQNIGTTDIDRNNNDYILKE